MGDDWGSSCSTAATLGVMSGRETIEVSLDDFARRVAGLPDPRPDDVARPLSNGETLADRMFTMCGLEAPSEAEIATYRQARER